MKNTPICKCGKNEWIGIPDSLALACIGKDGCGRVIVYNMKGGYEPGASIQKWLSDIHPEVPPLKDPDED